MRTKRVVSRKIVTTHTGDPCTFMRSYLGLGMFLEPGSCTIGLVDNFCIDWCQKRKYREKLQNCWCSHSRVTNWDQWATSVCNVRVHSNSKKWPRNIHLIDCISVLKGDMELKLTPPFSGWEELSSDVLFRLWKSSQPNQRIFVSGTVYCNWM